MRPARVVRALLPWLASLLLACGSSGGGGAQDAALDAALGATEVTGDVAPDVAPDDALEAAGPGPDAPAMVEHAGVTAVEEGGQVTLASDTLVVQVDLGTGLVNLRQADGTLRVLAAEARALLLVPGPDRTLRSSELATHTWQAEPFTDTLGEGLQLTLRHEGAEEPALIQRLTLRQGKGYLTVDAQLLWTASSPVDDLRVERLSPLVADAQTGGALFVGPDPATHRVLDNGYDLYFDWEARVYPLGAFGSIIAGPGTTTNWNAAIFDPASKRSAVAGFFSCQRGAGLVGLDYDAGVAVEDGVRKGLTRLEGMSTYMHGRAPLAGEDGTWGLTSELFYLEPAPADVFDALEAFAARYAARIGKEVKHDVPTGWNSWGGGSGSGGLGTNLNEQVILQPGCSGPRLRALRHEVLPDRRRLGRPRG